MVKRKNLLFMTAMVFVLTIAVIGCSSANNGQSEATAPTNKEIVFPEPHKPVMLSNNYGPGGTNQLILQAFQPFFEEELGGRVEIEYIEGAAGLIGYNQVYARPADGYSILMGSSTFGPYIYPHLSQEKPPWAYEDWVTLGIYSDIPNSGIVVKADSPFETFADLILYAREHPGELNIGTIGPGRIEDIQMIELQHVMGIKINQVPYDGGGTLTTDLLTGDLDAIVTASIQFADNTDVRILTFLAKELPENHPIPDAPALGDWTDELGFNLDDVKTLGTTHFNGLFVKAGLPDQVYEKLKDALYNITNNPEWQEKMKGVLYPKYRDPEEAKQIYDNLYEGVGEMLKLAEQYK